MKHDVSETDLSAVMLKNVRWIQVEHKVQSFHFLRLLEQFGVCPVPLPLFVSFTQYGTIYWICQNY